MLVSTSVDGDSEDFSSLASDPVPAPEALAAAARQRRAELRLSQEDIRKVSGLSITTIGKIEKGDPDLVLQTATMRRLDLALGWPVGTAEAWYHGQGGVVRNPTIDPSGDLARWVEHLAPLVAEQLRVRQTPPTTLSVVGLPESIVAALDHLIVTIRNHIVHGR